MTDKKKILFICQYFHPEVFRGNDIAFHWAQLGYHVHVITGIPNYPSGKFFAGYGLFKKHHEVINGVKVTHLPIFPRGNSKLMLMLNYFSFLIVSCIYMLWHSLFHKYDMIFCQQLSPVTMSMPAILYKKFHKVPLYTWVLDLWPESLTAAGGINNKYILSFFNWFVKKEYKYSDKILTSSRTFDRSILEYGDYCKKIIYFPQWGDAVACVARSIDISLPSIPDGFIVMFAGAIGDAHGMECNLQAALLTREYRNIKWVFVGDGRRLEWVKDYVKQHGLETTVLTPGRFPAEAMPWFFDKANVMLVSLSDSPLFNLYAPAKISSYMASGKPIIACLNGEGAEVVKQANCGWCVSAGDAESLANIVIELSKSDSNELSNKGINGLNYYNEFFEKEKCLSKLDEIMGLK